MRVEEHAQSPTSTSDTVPAPKMPPRWFVHGFWRVHRFLYRLSGGRFLWSTASKRGWGVPECRQSIRLS